MSFESAAIQTETVSVGHIKSISMLIHIVNRLMKYNACWRECKQKKLLNNRFQYENDYIAVSISRI